MAETANVCLRLSNRPENVLVVRQALTGVADSLALDPIEANDLNTAVTEACNNVVLHAYGGAEGPLEVDLYALSDGIAVVVRDHGRGIEPRDGDDADAQERSVDGQGGIGLPVIEALSRRARFVDLPDGGTEVRMEFAAAQAASLGPLRAAQGQETASARWAAGVHPSTVELRLAPNALARAVLPRVLSTLAARAYFSTDRISDVQLVADALAANADDSIDGSHLDVGITIAQRNLDLRIGPLREGHGESLVAVAADGLAPVIERLTDTRRVARDDAGETLELRLVDQG
jgi:serine/threonine-protein kinase RsbW